jgi:Xaa-Pro dipeptidase
VLAERFARRINSSIVGQALVTDPELVAYLAGFSTPFEEWPVGNPFVPCASVLVVGSRRPVLVITSMYESWCAKDGPETFTYRSYDADSQPEPVRELESTLAQAMSYAGVEAGEVRVDRTFPHFLVEHLQAHRLQPTQANIKPAPDEELGASVARAARLADVAQARIAALVEPGRSELELAGLALAAMGEEAGHRVSAIMTITTGPASGMRPGPATGRVVEDGDFVLCDVAPWRDGAWADAATTVCAGRPSMRQRRLFDAVRTALDLAVKLCSPGAIARDIDRAVRESLAGAGPVYRHHTGHGLGIRWWQEPEITPYGDTPLEEGMFIAVEPALYEPEIGGVRLEVTLRVGAAGNEILTQHDHRLTP